MIRGLFREKRHWGDFPEILASYLTDCNIHCVEIPGTGELNQLKTPASISGMLEAVRPQVPARPPYVVIGLSMGGMIALQWAKRYPNDIQAVICINTSNAAFSAFYERLKPENYWTIVKALWQNIHQRESNILKMVSNRKIKQQTLNDWISYAQQYPVSKLNFLRQLFSASRFRMHTAPDSRLLFITSSKDQLVNSHSQSAMAKQWHANEIVNEEDGHDIALDNPLWLSQVIAEFINQQKLR